ALQRIELEVPIEPIARAAREKIPQRPDAVAAERADARQTRERAQVLAPAARGLDRRLEQQRPKQCRDAAELGDEARIAFRVARRMLGERGEHPGGFAMKREP